MDNPFARFASGGSENPFARFALLAQPRTFQDDADEALYLEELAAEKERRSKPARADLRL